MAHAKYELRLDLSRTDLAALQTDDDFRREARRLLPAALEDLGRAMAELAWDRLADGPAARHRAAGKDRADFVLGAGRTYRRHAPAEERIVLEELIVEHLRTARRQASAETKEEPVWRPRRPHPRARPRGGLPRTRRTPTLPVRPTWRVTTARRRLSPGPP